MCVLVCVFMHVYVGVFQTKVELEILVVTVGPGATLPLPGKVGGRASGPECIQGICASVRCRCYMKMVFGRLAELYFNDALQNGRLFCKEEKKKARE